MTLGVVGVSLDSAPPLLCFFIPYLEGELPSPYLLRETALLTPVPQRKSPVPPAAASQETERKEEAAPSDFLGQQHLNLLFCFFPPCPLALAQALADPESNCPPWKVKVLVGLPSKSIAGSPHLEGLSQE